MTHILQIDASARREGSVTRSMTQRIISRLDDVKITKRDLSIGLPQINEGWVNANFTPADQRSDEDKATLQLSDELIAELNAADLIVIGTPIYNFSVPASLKAWIDLIARAGVTFNYTEKGPVGLLKDKRVIIAVASGGVGVGSDADFATEYLRHVLAFVGLDAVEIVAADNLALDAEKSMNAANAAIDGLSIAA